MPATPDYTLIQLMRGGKYAVETVIPECGEPLLDIESGTLYYGNGKDVGGIPINCASAIKLETPVNLDEQITWGRYYIEGKALNLPEGMELYNKFFLIVEGSQATEANSLFQTLHILSGDKQDQTVVRSSLDGGQSWTTWKNIGGSSVSFDTDGGGTVDKNPDAPLDEYVLSSYSYIESISGGPPGTEGKSGFLIVYRKNPESPYIYQELILSNPDENGGKVYCRLSATNNQNWNSPGYTWREISYTPATTERAGVVKLYNGVDSQSTGMAATANAVRIAYETALSAQGSVGSNFWVQYSNNDVTTPPQNLPNGGLIIIGS